MGNRLLTLHDPATASTYYKAGLWRDDTFYSLLADWAKQRPSSPALRDSGRYLDWAGVKSRVDALAAELAGAGLREGDRCALWISNRIEAVIAFIACSRQGFVCIPSLHRNYTVDEVMALLQETRTAALIAEEGYGARGTGDRDGTRIFPASRNVEHLRYVARLTADHTDDERLPATPPEAMPPHANGPDKICYLAFTSGTTGRPKGVMHSANSLLANPRDMIRDWGHDTGTILLSLSPLSHHIAWVGVAQWLLTGGTFVIDDPPEGLSRLDWLIECGANYVMGVPTHAMDILAEQRARGIERLGSVRVFYMAGAPIPRTTAEAFLNQGILPQNVYGMTENSSHQYTHPTDEADTIVSTCGRGGKAYEVRIFAQDDPDRQLPPGEVGQIGGRGAALMLGYFNNQESTEDSFNRDGWFLSGDLGQLDKKGCLRIVGRLKDVIIRGGHNIYPARIEELAVKHPGIAKAAAFAVADERLGERVCLAILPSSDRPPEADAVLDHLYAEGLSRFDMPEYYITLTEFPLTASGKILKRELAGWVPQGRIRPQAVRFRIPDSAKGS